VPNSSLGFFSGWAFASATTSCMSARIVAGSTNVAGKTGLVSPLSNSARMRLISASVWGIAGGSIPAARRSLGLCAPTPAAVAALAPRASAGWTKNRLLRARRSGLPTLTLGAPPTARPTRKARGAPMPPMPPMPTRAGPAAWHRVRTARRRRRRGAFAAPQRPRAD